MYRFELTKFFNNRIAIVLAAAFLIVPLFYMASVSTTVFGDDWMPEEYNKASAEAELMTVDQAAAQLREEMEAELFDQGISLQGKKTLLRELRQVADYEQYVDQMMNGGGNGLLSSETMGYEMRLKRQLQALYRGMSGKALSFTGSYGISRFLSTDGGDLLTVVFLLILVFQLVTIEFEQNMNGLLSSTLYGKCKLVRKKYLLGFAFAVTAEIIFCLSKLFIFGKAYHFQKWDGPIQSVLGFQGVPFDISIWWFVIVFIGMKLVSVTAAYTMLYFIAIVIKRPLPILVAEISLIAGSAVLMRGINTTSALGFLSLFSPARCMDIHSILAGYKTCNWFGYPVSYLLIWCLFFGTLFLCTVVGIWKKDITITEGNQREWTGLLRRKSPGDILKKTDRGSFVTGGAGSLFVWEVKKGFQLEHGIWLALLGLLGVMAFYQPPKEYIQTSEDYYYREYLREFAGEYTNDKQQALERERASLSKLQEDLYRNSSQYSQEALAAASRKLKGLEPLERMVAYGKYLKSYNNSAFVNENGYNIVLGRRLSESYLGYCDAFGLLLVIIASVRLWGAEEWNHMSGLLQSAKKNTLLVGKKKLMVQFLYCLLIGGIIYIPWLGMVLKTYPLGEWSFNIASIRGYEVLDGIPVLAVVVISYVLRLAYFFLMGILGKYIQKGIHSQTVSILLTWLCSVNILWWSW